MKRRDIVVLAARSVGRRPGRAVLTVMAVALAAALFAALLTIAGTARTRVLHQLSKGGPLSGIQVAAAAPDPTQIDNDQARPGEPKDLDDAAIAAIRALPDVRSVTPVVSARILVVPPSPMTLADGRQVTVARNRRGNDDVRGGFFDTQVGIDLTHAADLPISLLAGRLPTVGVPSEVAVTPSWMARFGLARTDAAAVLGVEVELGAPRDFGDSVRARWTRAKVVGVVAQQASGGAILAADDVVHAARAWTLAGRGDRRFADSSPYSGAFVIADSLVKVSAVRNEISDIGYSTAAPENLIATVDRYLHVVEVVLAGIAAIALAIAALGVTNAMLAAVRERRREIGVLKAIGARDRDVLALILVEAGVLGLVGGVLGTLMGLGFASIVTAVVNNYLTGQGLVGVQADVQPLVMLAGVVGAGVLAVLAGAAPAVRAARLPPREAVDA